MKKTHLLTIAGAAVLLTLAVGTCAEAGDTFSYRVSCTIPAIPGVNVPLVEETAMVAQGARQDQNIVEENSDSAAGGILVKTLYEK